MSTIKFFRSERLVGNMGESLYVYSDDCSDGPDSPDASTRRVSSDDEVEMDRVSLFTNFYVVLWP